MEDEKFIDLYEKSMSDASALGCKFSAHLHHETGLSDLGGWRGENFNEFKKFIYVRLVDSYGKTKAKEYLNSVVYISY